MAMKRQITGSRGTLAGIVAAVVGGWAIAAPAVFGADEAAQWGWNVLLIATVPGAAAVLGGLAMLARRRLGAHVALASGAWLALGSPTALLWAAGGTQAEVSADLLLWVVFFVQAGALIALSAAHVLGHLERLTGAPLPPRSPRGQRLRDGEACEARRRRSNVNLGSRPRARPQRAGRRPT